MKGQRQTHRAAESIRHACWAPRNTQDELALTSVTFRYNQKLVDKLPFTSVFNDVKCLLALEMNLFCLPEHHKQFVPNDVALLITL